MFSSAKKFAALGLLLAIFCACAFSQASAPTSALAPTVSPTKLIHFLKQTIHWYHQITVRMESARTPVDQMTAYANRQTAQQVVRLAFEFARQQADAIAETAPAKSSGTNASGIPQYQALQQMQTKLDADYQSTEAEMQGDQKKLEALTGAGRRKLASTISELHGELALIQARRDAVHSIVAFMSSSAQTSGGAAGLRAQIEALASSVPEATANLPQNHGNARPSAAATTAGFREASGIWGLSSELFTLRSKENTLTALIKQTQGVSAASADLRAPFIAQIRQLSSEGDKLMAQADTADRARLAQEKQQLDGLAAQFKRIATAVIPLSKQSVLLNLYQKNLSDQRDGIDARYDADMRNLGLHLGFLAVILAILFGLSELWRRAVFRYIHEPRRRHQFLLLRKFALWFVIALMVAVTLAGRLGSIATFAGLLTAGIALALQNVIVSVVGYFFLIGKYGIRIGDRVQAAGTTGEVIDVGLVRFHLMELGRGGTPTGRVVAFSNSIVFQPTGGLFKEIPGTDFAWHEVTTTVPRNADFTVLRQKLLDAAGHVLKDYREDIARQFQQMQKTGILLSENGLQPRFDLRMTSAGAEVTIRYPVALRDAAEIDARVSRQMVNTIESELEVKPEATEIHVNTDVPAGGSL